MEKSGADLPVRKHVKTPYHAYRGRPVTLSDNTNTHPAFGNEYKVERNRKLTKSVWRQTVGYMCIGDRTQETLSDPLHRKPADILLRARHEGSIAGRSRAYMRAAAPQQVTWKNDYTLLARTRSRRQTSIGPYTQGNLVRQSILMRISKFLGG